MLDAQKMQKTDILFKPFLDLNGEQQQYELRFMDTQRAQIYYCKQ